jgi:rare lipoprotein A
VTREAVTRFGSIRFFMLAAVVVAGGCAGGAGSSRDAVATEQVGTASYYARELHGGPTASGEIYDEDELTAAHRDLPFGTRVRVTNLENGNSVTLRINDRGPFVEGRIIDVSFEAARQLDFIEQGLTTVRVEVLAVP